MHPYHEHKTLEAIKIPVVIDGDLALTLLNIIGKVAEDETLDGLLCCGRTAPKLDALFNLLLEKTNVED